MKIVITFIVTLFTLQCSIGQKNEFEKLSTILQTEQLKEDVDIWLDWIHATHPDLSYSVHNIDQFYDRVNQIRANINEPLSILDFWKIITPLNSQLSDGHLIVGHISSGVINDFLDNGGALFPYNVIFEKDDLVIHSKTDESKTKFKNYTIDDINGVPIDTILQALLSRINGDNIDHRKVLLERKFSLFHLLMYGQYDQYNMTLSNNGSTKKIHKVGISVLPKFYSTPKFENNFNFQKLDTHHAILTINEFWWDDKEKYYSFMDSVFTDLQHSNIKHLLIDIRNNGGGDDEYWIQGILKYIADKPYRWGSTYKKKIVERYRDPGEVIGTVKTGFIDTLIPPNEAVQNKFKGKLSILVGPYTYSSAIVFANTVQDYKFGSIVGEPTGGKSGQTGGIQFSAMPHSGLRMICPRFYLIRPKGGEGKRPVIPDVEISYSKVNPKELITKLHKN